MPHSVVEPITIPPGATLRIIIEMLIKKYENGEWWHINEQSSDFDADERVLKSNCIIFRSCIDRRIRELENGNAA